MHIMLCFTSHGDQVLHLLPLIKDLCFRGPCTNSGPAEYRVTVGIPLSPIPTKREQIKRSIQGQIMPTIQGCHNQLLNLPPGLTKLHLSHICVITHCIAYIFSFSFKRWKKCDYKSFLAYVPDIYLLQWNLDLRKIVGRTDFLVHKLFDLRKIF